MDTRGQDFVEYALAAGLVSVSVGALMPDAASSVSTIFSKVSSALVLTSTQGG
jgi:Flp pilus assembly pilin Flp